jgi:hypothetical protein
MELENRKERLKGVRKMKEKMKICENEKWK